MSSEGFPARPSPAARLPVSVPAVEALDLDSTLLELLRARGVQNLSESYAGIPLMKLPEDLRVYEHIMWWAAVSVVVELGAFAGGSVLWFRDRLRTLADYGLIREPRVISVDLDVKPAAGSLASVDPRYTDTITLVEGDLRDPQVASQVAGLVDPGSSTLVVDDSAHTYETTTAALSGYSDLVQPGGFFIVEDSAVDIEEARLDPGWPRGVMAGMRDWLDTASGRRFTVRRDVELYGLTSHPQGFLQRIR